MNIRKFLKQQDRLLICTFAGGGGGGGGAGTGSGGSSGGTGGNAYGGSNQPLPPGQAGTNTSGGAGYNYIIPASTYQGPGGGPGGGLGSSGSSSNPIDPAAGGNGTTSGGSAGASVSGNPFITWVATGTRSGPIS